MTLHLVSLILATLSLNADSLLVELGLPLDIYLLISNINDMACPTSPATLESFESSTWVPKIPVVELLGFRSVTGLRQAPTDTLYSGFDAFDHQLLAEHGFLLWIYKEHLQQRGLLSYVLTLS